MKIWSLPKHENLTTGKKYCGKEEKLLLRSNFSSFPQYFQYISNFNSPITHIYLLNVVVRIIFSSILQIWYVELRISRSISEGPLEFEITRVDCNWAYYGILKMYVRTTDEAQLTETSNYDPENFDTLAPVISFGYIFVCDHCSHGSSF